MVIVGIGNLGHALANYGGFRTRGFRVGALVDADPTGRRARVAGVKVSPSTDLEDIVAEHGVAIGVIATPAGRGPGGLRPAGRRGVTSILNFARPCSSCPRGRRPQGRPVHRAADPRVPRAAQGCRAPVEEDGMSVLVVGLSHQTAPVALLERLALDADGVSKLLTDVVGGEHVAEATVLATCNRVEIYADVDRFHGSVEEISRLLCERAASPPRRCCRTSTCTTRTARWRTCSTSRCGLDSMVVGEGQILGQTREALRLAQELGTAGPALNVLFQQALRVGKRAHAETGIDRAAPSLVTAALDEASPAATDGRRVLVVGAGSMASLAAPPPPAAAPTRSRWSTAPAATPSGWPRVRRPALPLAPAAELANADMVISCTGAAACSSPRRPGRRGPPERPLAIIDLALPHDVDPAVATCPASRWSASPSSPTTARHRRGREVTGVRVIVARRSALPLRPSAGQRHADRGRAALDGHRRGRGRGGRGWPPAARPRRRPPAPRSSTPCAGWRTSCCTSRPSGSRSSPTSPARSYAAALPSCSRSTPTPSTPPRRSR